MNTNRAEAIIQDAERQIHLMMWNVERGRSCDDRYAFQRRRKILARYFISRYC
jgi:hypothetical protein